MKRKKLFLSAISAAFIAPSVLAVSCGRNEDSAELIKQNDLFKSGKAKTVANKIWVEQVLKKLYNVTDKSLQEEFANKNSQYYKDALSAFNTFSEFSLATDELFYLKQLSDWSSKGIFTKSEVANLASITKQAPNESQFNIIFKNQSTDLSFDINKLLLVNKYFEVKDESLLLKMHDDFAKNKPNYDVNQYNLLAYALSKNYVQKWEYVSKDITDLFSEKNKTISSIEDYSKLLSSTYDQAVVAHKNLLFSDNSAIEAKLGGYKGLTPDSISKYGLEMDTDKLKLATKEALYGFFSNSEDKSLIHLKNGTNELSRPIPLYNAKTNELSVTYLNLILPIGKKVETKDKDGKAITSTVLSFDNTIYAKNLSRLAYLFMLSDKTLYDTAKSGFLKLGYKLKVTDPVILEELKGSELL
ncbi:HinT-interacting membrane complex lipoprotein P60 [Mycoplasmopsis alligatoris]|uniref:Lipoprotein n=1 Tax=Mycoplasmopsis alligatoris A21JP2 TaxID=747682 RepID=D4XWL8_9BACT|nr:hypothetical protein [Mycoplasmopsis alligatoris]EFF41334.1 hypothetical protein MALL_0410 [Mycoplasmopsis alligatoris A21JP2]